VLNSKRSARHATGRLEEAGRGLRGGAGHVCGGVGYSAGDRDRDFYPPLVCASRHLRMRGRENGRSAPSGPAAALPGLEETSGRARLLCGLPVGFEPLGRARARLRMEKGTCHGWPGSTAG